MTVADLTRSGRPGTRRVRAVLVVLAVVCGAPAPLAAAPRAVDATVVWVGDAHVFVASRDTSGLEPGARLTFVQGRSVTATGTVLRMIDDQVAMVRLDAGTLARVKHPEKLKILSEPPILRGPPVIRLGFPSAKRINLLFDCADMTIQPPDPAAGYRVVEASGDLRLVRDGVAAPAPWPDTLVVRLFDDVADEEIALEGGQIDVAVFWPGEPSSHLRDGPFWREGAYGTRARGLIVSFGAAADSTAMPPAPGGPEFAALNRQVFRGDLGLPTTPGWAVPATPPDSASAPGRVVVDAALPGQPILQRFFASRAKQPLAAPDTPTVRLSYLDAPVDAPDSIMSALAGEVARAPLAPWLPARARTCLETMGTVRMQNPGEPRPVDPLSFCLSRLDAALLFSIRCPVACAPELRSVVNTIGLQRLADMMHCGDAVP